MPEFTKEIRKDFLDKSQVQKIIDEGINVPEANATYLRDLLKVKMMNSLYNS